MTDLDTRLAALQRARQPPPVGPDVVRGWARRRARRRHTVILVAATIMIVAGGLLVVRPGGSEHVQVGPAQPSGTPTSSVATTPPAMTTEGPSVDGWERWPSGPLDQLSWRAVAWTGTEFIVWRGESNGPDDRSRGATDRAAAYNPATRTWTLLPTDPLGSATYVTGVGTGGAWTGSEAVFWAEEGLVAWSPAEQRWRTSADAPRSHSHKGVWAGTEVLFVLDGLAYTPTSDSWRELALPPQGLEGSVNDDASWFARRGDTVAVVGSLAALYDVPTDTWRSVGSPLALPPNEEGEGWDGWTASVFVLGDKILALTGTGSRTIQLDEGTGEWVERPDLGLGPDLQATSQLDGDGGQDEVVGARRRWSRVRTRPARRAGRARRHIIGPGDGVVRKGMVVGARSTRKPSAARTAAVP